MIESRIVPIPGFSEPVSSWTHLLGAAASLVLAAVATRRARGRAAIAGVWVLGLTGAFAMSMSGVYHLLAPGGTARAVLQRLDHAGIFALIAGTFTAVHAILFAGPRRWAMIALLWVLAATAIPLTVVFFETMPEALSLTLYIGMGWLGLISAWMVGRDHGWTLLRPLIVGGVAYTTGAILEYLRWPVVWPGVIGPHELFHLAVLVGLGWHWRLVFMAAAAIKNREILPEKYHRDEPEEGACSA